MCLCPRERRYSDVIAVGALTSVAQGQEVGKGEEGRGEGLVGA